MLYNLHMSSNDHGSITSIDFGLQVNFRGVDEFADAESMKINCISPRTIFSRENCC